MQLYWVSKYSASGSWNGEATLRQQELDDAKAYLKELADKRESQNYDVSLADDGMRLDVSHDNLADTWTYTIEPERS